MDQAKKTPKILFVLTSQAFIPKNNAPTGWYLPELAHPWQILHRKAEITIASPKGGAAPLDPGSIGLFKNEEICSKFLVEQQQLWNHTVKLSEIVPKADEYDAIFYVGGHGPMFDLTEDPTSLALIQTFASAKKPIVAICHGPAALVNATTPNGESLLKGATVTGLSNDEENSLNTMQFMPFELETELNKKSEGGFVKADRPFEYKVVVSKTNGLGGPLITGQNPASGMRIGIELYKALGL